MPLHPHSPHYTSTQSLGAYHSGDYSALGKSPSLPGSAAAVQPPPKSRWGLGSRRSKPSSPAYPPDSFMMNGPGYVKTNGPAPSRVKSLFQRNKQPKTFTCKGISSSDYFAANHNSTDLSDSAVPTPPPSESAGSPQDTIAPTLARQLSNGRSRSNTQPPPMVSPPVSPYYPPPPPSPALTRSAEPDFSVITLRRRIPLSSLPAPLPQSGQPLLRKPAELTARQHRNIDLTEALPDSAPSPRGSAFPDHIIPAADGSGPGRVASLLRRVGSVNNVRTSALPTSSAPLAVNTAVRPTVTAGVAPIPQGFKEGDDIPLSALWSMMKGSNSNPNTLPKSPLRLPRTPRSSTDSHRSNLNMSAASLHTGTNAKPPGLIPPGGRQGLAPSYSGLAANSSGGPGPPPLSTHLAPRQIAHMARPRGLRPAESAAPALATPETSPTQLVAPDSLESPISPGSPTPADRATAAITASARRRAHSRPVPPPLTLPTPEQDFHLSSAGPLSAPFAHPGYGATLPNGTMMPELPDTAVTLSSPTSSLRSRPSISSAASTATFEASTPQTAIYPSHSHNASSGHASGNSGSSSTWKSTKGNRPTSSASYSSLQSPHKQTVQFSHTNDDKIRDTIRQQLLDEATFDAMLKKSKFTLKVSLTPQNYAS
ncbi:hypothetical protein IWQ60_002778 [Tieghemiomyces parasiticus]|uniref:Uncharacterized protein n=1 Tax=Tieghemiomyces parasiticus TaxID=78921 RepID=A0A9W8AAQ5_9FUNG|nr:hypothetical protein IWQ60_002778 [Tieghemiomyces parasiticus]